MDWIHESEIVQEALAIAGAEALRYVKAGFETYTKADRSPVTTADLAVNRLLQARLLDAFPNDGWLSEESPDGPERLEKQRVWVIDPIDGTSAFIKGEPEFCISVALVAEGRPVVAAVLNPSTAELYTAVQGDGLRLNGVSVFSAIPRVNGQSTVAFGHWEQRLGRFHIIEPQVNSRLMRSIAWAMALAASGHIDAVATFESQNEWDIAAGSLLIEEAGGMARDGAGQTLRFNQPVPRYRGLIATSRHCPEALARQIRSLSPS